MRGISLFLCTVLWSLPSVALAQQSLFNVPSGMTTATGNAFAQEQLNFGSDFGESNLTLDFGLGAGFELGLNVFHAALYGAVDPRGPDAHIVALNGSFTHNWSETFSTQTGLMIGVGEMPNGSFRASSLGWQVLRLDTEGWLGAWTTGVMLGVPGTTGPGTPVSALLGFELPIVHETLSLMCDLVLGDNADSVAVLGAVFYLPLGWQLSAGLQLPSPWSSNPVGLVIEITRAGVEEQPPHAVNTALSVR